MSMVRWKNLAVAGSILLASCAVVGPPAYSRLKTSRRTARGAELVRQAEASALAGDCVAVKQRADELRAMSGGSITDPEFLNDQRILDCMTAAPVASAPPSWFCTSSVLDDLCFCWRLETECATQQRRIAGMGATMNDCVRSATPTCRASGG